MKYLKRFRKKKIKYTKDMKTQDELWDTANEDLEVMFSLQANVIKEARNLGWKGFATTFIVHDGHEVVTEISDSQESDDTESFGTCRGLIKALEIELNK